MAGKTRGIFSSFAEPCYRYCSLGNKKAYSKISGTNEHYDIIISGGGMVGFAMLCALGKSDCLKSQKILLVESSSKKPFKMGGPYSQRVCALSPGSKALLQTVGAWKKIANARAGSIKKMQIWDACTEAGIAFGRADLGEEIAVVVENDLILDSLMEEAGGLGNHVEVLYSSKIVSYDLPRMGRKLANVVLDDGTRLSTDLIIGADGYNSGLRQAMNSQYISYNYDQMAVVATVRISDTDENSTAWQRFLPTGPIALLPLNNEFSSLVWSTDKTTAKYLLDEPEDVFIDRINQALWGDSERNMTARGVSERFYQMLKVCNINSLPDQYEGVRQLPPSIVEVQGRPGAFPLALGHAVDYVSDRVALIGDSAHRVHPLAGQGVNLGFGDVRLLADVICQAVSNGSDVGSLLYLKHYQSSRQKHNLPIMAAIHALHFLYGTTWTPAVVLRSVGLNILDSLPSIKRAIISKAAT